MDPDRALAASGFNPRTYIRYDLKYTLRGLFLYVSIHVPI